MNSINNQQFTAQFSINAEQARNTIKQLRDEIKSINDQMRSLDRNSATYEQDMKKLNIQLDNTKETLRQMQPLPKAIEAAMKNLDNASPRRLRETMRDINRALDSGAVKRGTKDWDLMLGRLKQVKGELDKINREINAAGNGKLSSFFGAMFGNFGAGSIMGGISKIAGIFGIATTAAGAFAQVVRQIITLNKEFEQQQANLASILGKTKDQIVELTKQAKQLGDTTVFTASQVSGLQINLAKLGFTEREIIQSTRPILDFAAATGAALPEAAEVAGAALRSFGLDASEMERVVSTMAVATTKSALDFEKLRTSISITFPVAKAFGFSIEDTVALLGKLSDAGFEASSAATATRNILLNMANPAGRLAKTLGRPIRSIEDLAGALKELKDRNIDLAEAFALTDKRSVSAFKVFVEASDKLVEMRESITDVSDELNKMVETRLDTLEGSTILLTSAWQGLMLTFQNSTGTMKSVVDWFTDVVHLMTDWLSTSDEISQRRIDKQVEDNMNDLLPGWRQLAKELANTDDIDAMAHHIATFSSVLDDLREKATGAKNALADINNNVDDVRNSRQWSWTLFGLSEKPVREYISGWMYGDEQASAEEGLADLETEIRKYEFLIDYLRKAIEKLNSPKSEPWEDPYKGRASIILNGIKRLQIEEQKRYEAEKIAAQERKASLEEMERIEEDHWERWYQIEIDAYSEVADMYREIDKKKSEQYTGQMLSSERELAKKLTAIRSQFQLKEQQEAERQERIRLRNNLKRIAAETKLAEAEAKARRDTMVANGVSEYQADLMYADMIYKVEVDSLHKKMALYDEDSTEYQNLLDEKAKATEKFEEKVAEINQKWQGKANTLYDSLTRRDDPFEQYRQQLRMLDQYHKDGLLSEKSYQEAINAIQRLQGKRTLEIIADVQESVRDMYDSVQDYIAAKYDARIESLEASYDKEIKFAEKYGRDTTKLEEEKEAAVTRMKLKQAEEQYKSDVARTFMDAAVASLKVWANPGWPMAIPLQAMIVAQQAFSIATLKKQYEAQKSSLSASLGYYDGGYTGSGSGNNARYRRPAGVVHDGEFVANHEAVNNPNVRPVLDAIDYAQRNNSISRMTSADLAAANGFANGGYTGQTTAIVQAGNSDAARLSAAIEYMVTNGIDARCYVNGRSGIDAALAKKKQLLANKSK